MTIKDYPYSIPHSLSNDSGHRKKSQPMTEGAWVMPLMPHQEFSPGPVLRLEQLQLATSTAPLHQATTTQNLDNFEICGTGDAFPPFHDSACSSLHEYGESQHVPMDLPELEPYHDVGGFDLDQSRQSVNELYHFPLHMVPRIESPVYMTQYFQHATAVRPFMPVTEDLKPHPIAVAQHVDPHIYRRQSLRKSGVRERRIKRKREATPSSSHKTTPDVDVRSVWEPSSVEAASNEANIPGYLVMRPEGLHESKRQRSRLSPIARINTAAVRQRGACFKCRMWRKKCDLGSPCQNCIDPATRSDPVTIFSQPCFRLDLEQCGFFRKKSALWNKPLRDSMKWVSRAEIVLSVQPGSLRDYNCPSFDVVCSHYQPELDDIVQRKYGPRRDQTLIIPCYCAVNTRHLKEQIPIITDNHLKYLMGRYEQGLEYVPPILLDALRIARVHEARDPLLKIALKLWVSSRFLAAPRSLRGDEKLGMEPVSDSDAHDEGYIPIPPMLDYQIDTMTIRWLTEQTDRLLKGLWKKLSKRDKGDWFLVFLTIFLLLHNLEGVHQAQHTFIQEHGGSDFGRFIEQFSSSMMEQWQWTYKHLLFVFRYYIRRCALDNRPIFSDECFEEGVDLAKMDYQEQRFYRGLIVWRQDIMDLNGAGAPPHYSMDFSSTSWCSQLLFTGLEDAND